MCSKKTENLNIHAFKIITQNYDSTFLTKDISCNCKYKFDSRKWDNDKCWCDRKKHLCEKDCIWNLAPCSCKNEKYLTIINDNSVVKCDEI